jgi:hypothetical protein
MLDDLAVADAPEGDPAYLDVLARARDPEELDGGEVRRIKSLFSSADTAAPFL